MPNMRQSSAPVMSVLTKPSEQRMKMTSIATSGLTESYALWFELFENQNAEIDGLPGNRGDRQRDAGKQPAHVHERQLVERERRIIDGKDDRRIVGPQDPEILARRGVAGERHHAYVRPAHAGAPQALIDARAGVLKRR